MSSGRLVEGISIGSGLSGVPKQVQITAPLEAMPVVPRDVCRREELGSGEVAAPEGVPAGCRTDLPLSPATATWQLAKGLKFWV